MHDRRKISSALLNVKILAVAHQAQLSVDNSISLKKNEIC